MKETKQHFGEIFLFYRIWFIFNFNPKKSLFLRLLWGCVYWIFHSLRMFRVLLWIEGQAFEFHMRSEWYIIIHYMQFIWKKSVSYLRGDQENDEIYTYAHANIEMELDKKKYYCITARYLQTKWQDINHISYISF